MRATTEIDPIKLAQETEEIVTRGVLRKYYRMARPEKWYGGIASAYCCGCCLRCVFCFSGFPRDHPEKIGEFYTPKQVFDGLITCAQKYGYKQLRITGNEPTISKEHLFHLLEMIDKTQFQYILESNGILIGHDPEYARQLSKFEHVHVRISIKGTNREEFSKLTRAKPDAFNLQLKALENLLNFNVSCHPAVMVSFSLQENFEKLKEELLKIDQSLIRFVEEEYVILYPPVVRRLKESGIKPRIYIQPKNAYKSKYYA
jgi:uncharacterized Fe-S cluster-containing radical SAM superfamily protein